MAKAKRETKAAGKSKPARPGKNAAKESEGRLADSRRSLEGNQGEGNREADRLYREAATNFERSGRVPKAADEARRAVEDEEQRLFGRGRDDDIVEVEDYEDDRSDEEEARREARDRSRLS